MTKKNFKKISVSKYFDFLFLFTFTFSELQFGHKLFGFIIAFLFFFTVALVFVFNWALVVVLVSFSILLGTNGSNTESLDIDFLVFFMYLNRVGVTLRSDRFVLFKSSLDFIDSIDLVTGFVLSSFFSSISSASVDCSLNDKIEGELDSDELILSSVEHLGCLFNRSASVFKHIAI